MQHETFWLIFILSWQLTCRQTSVACIKGKPFFQSKNVPHEFTNIVKKHNTFCNFVVCWSSLLCSLWQRRWDYFKRIGAMNIVINVMKIFWYTLDEIEWFVVVLWSLRIYFKMCVCVQFQSWLCHFGDALLFDLLQSLKPGVVIHSYYCLSCLVVV